MLLGRVKSTIHAAMNVTNMVRCELGAINPLAFVVNLTNSFYDAPKKKYLNSSLPLPLIAVSQCSPIPNGHQQDGDLAPPPSVFTGFPLAARKNYLN